MIYILLLLGFLVVLVMAVAKWASESEPEVVAFAIKAFLAVFGSIALILLTVSGKLLPVLGFSAFVIPLFVPLFWKRKKGGKGSMSQAEAYEVLGLKPGSSKAQIEKAYQRLIKKVHPDAEGSNYLAAKINQARETLLGKKS